uniref:Alpha-2,8-sialyltransferase 8E-like n=1 Tax=Saccoglossus kowalevskii TaxID=10224 RepID=A0ABM0LZL3_SACKO|nr:PREDICTED: alpha-2,8-sialyltransferase 8E-like [Saccoglossus kowalevskii]
MTSSKLNDLVINSYTPLVVLNTQCISDNGNKSHLLPDNIATNSSLPPRDYNVSQDRERFDNSLKTSSDNKTTNTSKHAETANIIQESERFVNISEISGNDKTSNTSKQASPVKTDHDKKPNTGRRVRKVRKVRVIRVKRKRKDVLEMAKLKKDLNDTFSKLQNWKLNMPGILTIRNKLKNYLNKTDFICTQENTHIGTQYYDTMFNKSVYINESNLQLLPKTSVLSSKTAFKKCAIVGNGGILRNSGCGDEIDRFDFIMRSNLQPIRGFTFDAGSKFSFTSISQSLMTRYRVYEDEKFVRNFTNLNITKLLKDLEEYKGYLLWIPNSKVSNLAFQITELLKERTSLEVLLFNAEHSQKIQSFWGLTKKGLSTGMTLLSIGFSLCEETHLYGFWPFPIDHKGNPLPMHYTNDIAWSTYNKFHDYPSEFSLLTGLHRQGLLKIHTGKCH